VSARTRTCLGCEGTGGLVTCARPALKAWRRAGLFACGSCAAVPDGSYYVVVPYVDIADGACHGCGEAFPPCPACLGAGAVTDRTGFWREGRFLLDAEADFQTLVLFMRDGRHFMDVRYPDGWALGFTNLGAGTTKAIALGRQHQAARRAVHAARAAFRAVPALKAAP
jgi:hypothetical protein